MIQIVEKGPKVALCRKCHGTGIWIHQDEDGTTIKEKCPACEGSGRVTVSAKMEYDIRPYRQQKQ